MGIIIEFLKHEGQYFLYILIMCVAHKLLSWLEARQKKDPTLKAVLWLLSRASLFGAAILGVAMVMHFVIKYVLVLWKDLFSEHTGVTPQKS